MAEKNGKAAEAKAAEAKPKKERKKRERKPIEIPDPSKFEGPARIQLETVLTSAKMFVESIKGANSVAPSSLNAIKRGIVQSVSQHLRGLKRDPVEKRKAKLEAQIAKATAALEKLLKEDEAEAK